MARMQETLHGLLEASAADRGDQICLKMSNHKGYTYKEVLDKVMNCAAHLALLEADILLLVADRSYGMVLMMLGTLRAGKAYCPIEPDYPAKRISDMLQTACIHHALVPIRQHPQLCLGEFPWLQVLVVTDDGQVQTASGNPQPKDGTQVPESVADDGAAYVLFTSGSTGKPKGCQVPHRGSTLYAKSVVESCNLTEDMVFVLKTPYVFDVHVQDMFTALAAGATLVIAEPGAHKDAAAVANMIITEKINVACFVPTLLVEFVNYLSDHPEEAKGVKAHLKKVLTIGEALMTSTCLKLFDLVAGVEVHNLYGPTEASVGVSHFNVTVESLGDSSVAAIGKPYDYTAFRVFDPSKYDGKTISADLLVDVDDGCIGELFIGGDCLAHGYINDPDKTAAAFFNMPEIQPNPPHAASSFTLYKTGDLVRRRPEDGIFEYLGRCDFQVKIGGVRIECEEVSSVLLTHPAINDVLVTSFDGPQGKALVAYVVAAPETTWDEALPVASSSEKSDIDSTQAPEDTAEDLVSKWGAVYDEMYQDSGEGVAESDPTLNWSGYVDTYSRRTHIQPVIEEWVEWSCEQVLRYKDLFSTTNSARPRCVTELGCGNGMLLFRIAPTVTATLGGRYIGTDISTTALQYIKKICTTDGPYKGMTIDTKQIAAHEILTVCEPRSNDVVLCNGVTMYFPSASYLLQCMQTAVDATADGGYAVFGDIQSKRHVLYFHTEVQTFQALRRPDATATAVLRAARQAAASEGLSYFDDAFFHHLEHHSLEYFHGRVARLEMRLKRGWWHSEFSRFRYDVELIVEPACRADSMEPLSFQQKSYQQVCEALHLDSAVPEFTLPMTTLADWIKSELSTLNEAVAGMIVPLPNARTWRSKHLLAWLEAAVLESRPLTELPHWLRPLDVELGGDSRAELAKYGFEPEALFSLSLPDGWTQRVIWSEDPGMLDFVILRSSAAQRPWLSAVRKGNPVAAENIDSFKNNPDEFAETASDPRRACNKALKAWASQSSLLPAMRPTVYVALDEFPKNQAGKTDRGKLPDAAVILAEISDATALEFEEPENPDEEKMVHLWQEIVKVPVSANTPFVAYGGNSLTALRLASKITDVFGVRPDFAFLTSEDCSVRELVRKIRIGSEDPKTLYATGCVLRLSPADRKGLPLLIFGAAGTSSATYEPLVEHLTNMQVYCVELPGRGLRADEALDKDFTSLFSKISEDVMQWAKKTRRFFFWGDSVGTVFAYEMAKKLQKTGHYENDLLTQNFGTGLLGLIVSGNAGPTVAAMESGMGQNTAESLGWDCPSVSQMTLQDWKKFYIAASGKNNTHDLQHVLEDDELAEKALGPLIADCTVYETYGHCDGVRLRDNIYTIRGQHDLITSKAVMKSWERVAGGRVEHIEIPGSGHMLIRDATKRLAQQITSISLPDFSNSLPKLEKYRAKYRYERAWYAEKAQAVPKSSNFNVLSSPAIGPRSSPKNMPEFDLDMLSLSGAITPQTKNVKQLRSDNMSWRRQRTPFANEDTTNDIGRLEFSLDIALP